MIAAYRRGHFLACLPLSVLLIACGCGKAAPVGPTGPSPTAPPPTVVNVSLPVIPALTTIGQTLQLTATALMSDGTKTDVTGQATWTSGESRVVTVSANGLLTAMALGTTTISASFGGKTGNGSASVVTNGPIVTCGSYPASATYTLAGKMSPNARDCLRFTAGSGGSLDCFGQDAGSITVSNVQGFTVRNCLMHATIAQPSGALLNLTVSDSAQLVIDNVDVTGRAIVQACMGCTLSHSSLLYPPSGFRPPSNPISCVLCLTDGSNNVIVQNTIDGGYDGNALRWEEQGVDDTIVMAHETNLTIRSNVLRNAFDAAIEPVGGGPITMTIVDNQITNMGFTGIGSYYAEGFIRSVFSGNTVSHSPNFLHFSASPEPGVTTATFVDNQFTNNAFRDPIRLPPNFGANIPDAVEISPFGRGSYTVSGNLFQNNDFGTASGGPYLIPIEGFIDGGGNLCSASITLKCNGGGLLAVAKPHVFR